MKTPKFLTLALTSLFFVPFTTLADEERSLRSDGKPDQEIEVFLSGVGLDLSRLDSSSETSDKAGKILCVLECVLDFLECQVKGRPTTDCQIEHIICKGWCALDNQSQ